MLQGKIKDPRNKGNEHAKQENSTGLNSTFQILFHKKGNGNAHHPCEEKAKHGKLDIGYHTSQQPAKEQRLTVHGLFRIFLLKITQDQIKSGKQERQTDLLRASSIIKAV